MKTNKIRKMQKQILVVVLLATLGAGAQAQQFYTSTPSPVEVQDDEGVDAGIFKKLPFLFNISLREGFDDNVYASRNKTSSFFTNVGVGLSYAMSTPRFRLATLAGGGVTYYYSRPGRKVDLTGNLGVTAKYLVTPRLEFDFSSYSAYISQPDSNVEGTSANRQGNYFYSSNTLSGSYQWSPKFSTVTSYTFRTYVYEEAQMNNDQGRIEQTFGQSFNYLVLPKTTAVAEYRVNPVTYFDADLNSLGNYFLLGVNQTFNPRLSWTARAGAEWRILDNPVDGRSQYIGPYGESQLTYRFAPASNIHWLLRYGTEGSGVAKVTQRTTFRTSVGITHAFTARINGTARLGFINSYYDQPGVINDYYQNTWEAALGVNYQINRVFSVSLGYTFTGVASDNQGTEYNRNIVFLGANANF